MSENRSLVTIANLSKEKIMYLLQMAQEFENVRIERFWTIKSWQLSSLSRLPAHAFRLKPQQTVWVPELLVLPTQR